MELGMEEEMKEEKEDDAEDATGLGSVRLVELSRLRSVQLASPGANRARRARGES